MEWMTKRVDPRVLSEPVGEEERESLYRKGYEYVEPHLGSTGAHLPFSPFMGAQIKAFHGSPYKFDKFKAEKIGTGEGHQAFGYGLYFSDKKEIARTYATPDYDHVAKLLKKDQIGSRFLRKARSDIEQTWGGITDREAVIELKNSIKYPDKSKLTAETDKELSHFRDYLDEIYQKWENTYSVTLHKGKEPGEYDYLKWDEPVGKDKIDKVLSLAKKEGVFKQIDEMGDLYQQGGHSGQALYKTISLGLDSDKAASAFLLRAGIDGIEYPAGSLSGGGKGAKNYVVFDENAITIEK